MSEPISLEEVVDVTALTPPPRSPIVHAEPLEKRQRYTLPLDITAHSWKKRVRILEFGSRPIAWTRGNVLVPDSLRLETFYRGYMLVGSTRVINETQAMYKFELSGDPEKSSVWCTSPTGALNEISRIVGIAKHAHGTNGRLVLGMTYKPIQTILRDVFL